MAKKTQDAESPVEPQPEVQTNANPPKLTSVGYALIEKGEGLFQAVKFRFDPDQQVMGPLEVLSETHNQFDTADELFLTIEEEIYQ